MFLPWCQICGTFTTALTTPQQHSLKPASAPTTATQGYTCRQISDDSGLLGLVDHVVVVCRSPVLVLIRLWFAKTTFIYIVTVSEKFDPYCNLERIIRE